MVTKILRGGRRGNVTLPNSKYYFTVTIYTVYIPYQMYDITIWSSLIDNFLNTIILGYI